MGNRFTPTKDLAVVRHAISVYESMLEQSTVEAVNSDTLDLPETLPVFRGSYATAYNALKISKSYYKPIRSLLVDSECLIILEGGNYATNKGSVIALVRPPSAEDAEAMSRDDLTRTTPGATIRSLAQLTDDVKKINHWIEIVSKGLNIANVLRNFEKRITALEAQIGTTGSTVPSKQSKPTGRRENAKAKEQKQD